MCHILLFTKDKPVTKKPPRKSSSFCTIPRYFLTLYLTIRYATTGLVT